ncbi:MAG: hypothetical protein E7253_07145 [Lachnospiraceae bacterium]|nr:hypothetical protein [Lachnospiraceae bacterium]
MFHSILKFYVSFLFLFILNDVKLFYQSGNSQEFPRQSPEAPEGAFRDCKRSPMSRASSDFGSSPAQKRRQPIYPFFCLH